MAYQFMKANKNRYTIKETADLFWVSRSAYYQWVRNGLSQRRETIDAELVRLIRNIVMNHHRRYGSPRVRRELRDVYWKKVSRKKVARLMRENGLNARQGSLSRRPIPNIPLKFVKTYSTGSFMLKKAGISGFQILPI
jgi:hypothetical protein